MGVMQRWSGRLAVAVIASVPFSSCTCQRDLPEPPAQTSRVDRDPWAGLPTPRGGDRLASERDLPKARATPMGAPTLPPTPPEEVELPDDFPSDVPIVDGAELYGVQNVGRGGKNVLFRTDEDIPQVFEFYKDSMRGEGWNVKQEYQQNNQSFLSFEKDQTVTNMTVVQDPATGKRIIALMYYEQEPLPFPEF